MDAIHARRFLDGANLSRTAYDGCDGVHVRSSTRSNELIQDIARFSRDAYLFSCDYVAAGELHHRQIVEDGDWIHIQFRLNGGGREQLTSTVLIETPESACIVTRYPRGSVIDRRIEVDGSCRVACLFLKPQGVIDLLHIDQSAIPMAASWLTAEASADISSLAFPLKSSMVLSVQDILGCRYTGGLRHSYMRAKAQELLASVVYAITSSEEPKENAQYLSRADLARIVKAEEIIRSDLEANLTLAELARHVGLNRTKLAIGFKQIYGTSVQAYWRDIKLEAARERLCVDGATVTEVAYSLGYSELSSFTRAFTRKYGILPRECRRYIQ